MKSGSIVVLGISAFYHDSAAAIVVDGEIIAAAEEERFTRKKHTSDFPINAINFCLEFSELTLNEVDEIVFYDKPFLKFERILEQTYLNIPGGFKLFRKGIPNWLETKINLRKTIRKELRNAFGNKFPADRIKFTTHHYAHAASAYYPSPFAEAAILVIDGVGEHATASIGIGREGKIELLKEMHFPDSVGMLYSAFTYFLGFRVNNGEYKLMGLSPYGNEFEASSIIEKIKEELVQLNEDGSIKLNMDYFAFGKKDEMIYDKTWEVLFQIKRRREEEQIIQEHADLALAIQRVTEEIIEKMVIEAKALTGLNQLVLAGGVALNCVANGKIIDKAIFDKVWIQPAAGDSGGAIGAAIGGHYLVHKNIIQSWTKDRMKGTFLGSDVDVEKAIELAEKDGLNIKRYVKRALTEAVVDLIVADKLVGWVNGRMEFGPRALGARSIIASPLNKANQTKINRDVKFREDFRPFAPAMLREEAVRLYGYKGEASYMQVVNNIKEEYRTKLGSEVLDSLDEKIKWSSSVLGAVTHVDFSSRLQIVEEEEHPFYDLLKVLKERTGYGVVLNTSFNQGGEPIVCSAEEIINTFVNTGLEYLVLEDYIISKAK